MPAKRIHNLDSFYALINNHIEAVYSFTRVKYIQSIIKMCRLKPHSMVLGLTIKERNKKLDMVKWWIDEFGNSLKIVKNKRIKIVLDDEELDGRDVGCTDLYHCLPLDKIAKMSKLVYLLAGVDMNSKHHAILAFLGLDNYLRVYSLNDGQWKQISPLQLNMKTLKQIVKYSDIKYYKDLTNKDIVVTPCIKQESWLSYWPAHEDFLQVIKNYDHITNILKLKEKNG